MIIRKNSWHYIYADRGSVEYKIRFDRPIDFCSYARSVMLGLVRTLLVYGFAMVPFVILVDFGAWLLAYIVTGHNPGVGFGPVAVCGVGIFALGYLLVWAVHLAMRSMPPREPGFVATAYRSWKDKYCPIVEIEGEMK